MSLNDITENQDAPPQEPKVPNLLKNREMQNGCPSGTEPTNNNAGNEFLETKEELFGNEETVGNNINNEPPGEETLPFDNNGNQDFAPDDNGIPHDNYEIEPDDANPPSFIDTFSEAPHIGEFTLPDDYIHDDLPDYETAPEENDTDVVSEIETAPDSSGETQYSSAEEETLQETEPYIPPEKINSAEAMGKMQPLKLNRQMILALILGSVCICFLFASFILPALRKKAEAASQKKYAEQTDFTDYSLYSQRQPYENDSYDNDNYPYYEFSNDSYASEPSGSFPEPQIPQQQQQPSSGTYLGSGSGERPDTRNDRLQAKSISGIKGLSSSRQNFAAPVITNMAAAASSLPGPASNNPYAQFGMPPKDEYIQNILNTYTGNSMQGNSYNAQNDQNGKLDFMNRGRENAGTGQWLPPNSVWQGTIFEAVLASAINTDLPGECAAWITKNVYSSLDGTLLLIPQNSRLIGSYNSAITYAQSRVQVGWHTLIRPDGYMINLGNMNTADPQGATGLKGFINDHPFAYLKALGLITAINLVNTQFGASMNNTDNPYVQNIIANTQDVSNRLADKIIERALDIQPTIIISSGTQINIVVNQNLTLPPLTSYEVTNKYQRGN